jgi:hypothetical protein
MNDWKYIGLLAPADGYGFYQPAGKLTLLKELGF